MNLTTPLEIGILWNTPEASDLLDLGIESEDDFFNPMTFFTIDNIGHYRFKRGKHANKPYSAIVSSGELYVTELTYEALKGLISKHL